MRIGRVTIGYTPRRCGWSRHARSLSEEQWRQGHSVHVLHVQGEEGQRNSTGVCAEHVGLGPLESKWDAPSVRLLFASLACRRLLRLHAVEQLDVIHVHGDVFEAYPLARLGTRLGVPVVVTVHAHLSEAGWYRRVAPQVWQAVDGVIGVSPRIVAELVNLGVHRDRVAAISSGVDLNMFHPVSGKEKDRCREELGIPRIGNVVVAAGRLEPMKGLEYLIDAVGQVSGSDSTHLYIVGQGQLCRSLEGAAANTPQIHIVGEVSHATVRTYLRAADLFALPSIRIRGTGEGTPTAILEAMATGLPIVTTDSGGTRELLGGADDDLVFVPERDAQALRRSMTAFLASPEKRTRVSRANFQKVQERGWPQIAAAVTDFCRAVRGEGRARG